MVRYNKDYLYNYCSENNIILLQEYDLVNRETIISGNCKSSGCDNLFYKTFRMLTRTKNFCGECSVKNGKIKSIDTNITKYGVKSPLQNEDIKNKMKATNLIKYGVENPFQNEDIKNKMKETNITKYGVESPLQNEDIKNKRKETNLLKYGVESPLQNEDIKNKIKATNIIKYGVKYTLQNENVKNKMQATNLKKYGNTMALQNNSIKEKAKNTILKKYGVEYISQCPYISDKQNNYRNKFYILPSGNVIKLQGYENYALDILIKSYNENEILNKRIDMPKFTYENNKKNHVYFPDFFIPKDNLIIEVKSTYTYKKYLITNILKAHCVRRLKFNYELWIFDDKRNLLII